MSQDILINSIDTDPAQPRKHFDGEKIAELAESMHGNGLIVPIMVRPVGDRFVIVHGERRYRAAVSLGWATIPADVRELDSDAARWFALVENIQRADLSPIEEASAYKAMLDTGITQTELGKRIGKGQSYIATKLRLLTLPNGVKGYIDRGELSEGHAKQLLRLDSGFLAQDMAQHIVHKRLTVAATNDLVTRAQRHQALVIGLSKRRSEADALLSEVWPGHPYESAEHLCNHVGFCTDMVKAAFRRIDAVGRYTDVKDDTWQIVTLYQFERQDYDPTEEAHAKITRAAIGLILDSGEPENLFWSGDYLFDGFPTVSRDMISTN